MPSPGIPDVSGFVALAVGAGRSFTASIGLQSAVRHTDLVTGFTHHGWLNLLVATLRALTPGLDTPVEQRIGDALAITDGEALAAELAGVGPDAALPRPRAVLVVRFDVRRRPGPRADPPRPALTHAGRLRRSVGMTGLRVAFLGPHGTFCEQALRTLTPADLDAALGNAEPSEHPVEHHRGARRGAAR